MSTGTGIPRDLLIHHAGLAGKLLSTHVAIRRSSNAPSRARSARGPPSGAGGSSLRRGPPQQAGERQQEFQGSRRPRVPTPVHASARSGVASLWELPSSCKVRILVEHLRNGTLSEEEDMSKLMMQTCNWCATGGPGASSSVPVHVYCSASASLLSILTLFLHNQ
ncbi:hypothetical protein NDU88_004702 [Pleurodeles waltl]|uniref:Uncharacterized protein n=1 Tax=Pleurodeles waltl TaxID=8319 RepID=A0AAV7WVX1_PLEWA|nr:hypothetical protein NDU88_004702 [Pleurodeles waltl]